jgi:4-amino-4-deoxy-L-arabinose transferase-like glycosyltransferase
MTQAPEPAAGFWTTGRLAWGLGLAAGLAVLCTLADPGLTIDEPLDVRPGRTYVATLRSRGWRFFDRAVVDAVFRDNAEHPPLGRWLLGWASTLCEPFEVLWQGGPDPVGLYILAGRVAPALSFAVLVGLVAWETGRRYGRGAGVVAAFALAAMPRVVAHAHFGALDTFLCLFWTFALIRAERALEHRRPVPAMAGAGVAWSLALLTKIHAWLLIPILAVWSCIRLGPAKSMAALGAWATTGLTLFFVGWPWLWYDTAHRLANYLGTGVERAVIHVEYFGRVYADRDLPWHYPWFYFLVTVPIGLHALGAVGLAESWRKRRRDKFPWLLAGSIAFLLALFSTRVPVYDSERLFLVVFPLWAILIGVGFASAWRRFVSRPRLRLALAAFVLAQGYGVVAYHPFGLSYYNALVGGLRGAEHLGLELTYWGDAVDRVLLNRLARDAEPNDRAALAPTLYPGQGMTTTTRAMARRPVVLGDENTVSRARWVVVYRRTAYWRPELKERLARGRCVLSRRRQGVWLSALWELPQ